MRKSSREYLKPYPPARRFRTRRGALNAPTKLKYDEKLLCLLLAGALNLAAAEKPADKTLPVRGFCIPAPSGNRVDEFIKFIEEELAPRSVNALILRVDYGFQFTSRPEMADKNGLSKEQAQKIAAACKKHQIRIIPLVNLLGHQSWQSNCGKLLQRPPGVRRDSRGEVSREIRLAQSRQALLQELLPASSPSA